MPLPIILGVGAAIAGVTGIGSGIHGAVKMKDANDTMKMAERRHQKNIERFEEKSETTNKQMDKVGTLELNILKEFEAFSDTIEKIQNRPQFKEYKKDNVKLPVYDNEKIKEVSVGAGVMLGGLGGAAVGTAGGFAAAGVTTSAVMALGTASTGTAIASLSGAAATNATLAALGGGAIGSATFAGGMELGAAVLGATTLGVGLLVGGVVFGVTGNKLSDKADEAYYQMREAEKKINQICIYLEQLETAAKEFYKTLQWAQTQYDNVFKPIQKAVNVMGKTDWKEFSTEEKLQLQNSVLMVQLLYKMCQVNLVVKAENEEEVNEVNQQGIDEAVADAEQVIGNLAYI